MIRQALVLVGGRGTRLGDAARDYPKPLVPIAGDTRFLDYLIEDIARHGIEDIILLAGHLAEKVVERYEGKQIRNARLRVTIEPSAAGTAGALRYVADDLDDVFLLTNGDSFLDMNYLALAQALKPNDLGAMALRSVPDAKRFGRVETKGDRVVAFREKDPTFEGPSLISAGVYALRRSVIALVGEPPCSLETEIFPRLVANNALACHVFDGHFVDIGLPDTLQEARATLPEKLRRSAVLFDRDGTLIHDDGYTHAPEALRWQPGAIEAVRHCNDAGALAIVVTNQAGVARGYYDENAVDRFHAHMQSELRLHGAHIDAFYYCPYHGDGVVSGYALANHPDRKPNPGMLRRALLEWRIDPARAFVVGDTDNDSGAAQAAGLRHFIVKPGALHAAVLDGLQKHQKPQSVDPIGDLKQRADTARAWLFDHALPLWWERGFDRDARCFQERMAQDGTPLSMPRRIRVQARQTLVYARAGRMGWPGPWREAVEAGADVLMRHGLRADGGTRHLLNEHGEPADDRRDLYDHAFVVLGLSEAALALGSRDDLIAGATSLTDWTEANWAHAAGGFAEGDITPTPPRRQNPHMHWFEAMLALHEVSGERAPLDRATKIATLFESKFFNHRFGAVTEYFDDTWRPQPEESGSLAEPGHGFEWSWLIQRWTSLGGGDLGAIAERLRVNGELYGINARGDVYDDIHLDGRPRTLTTRLWPHTERVKANAVRFERARDPNAAASAIQAFDAMMGHCEGALPGLWRDQRSADGALIDQPALASSLYHVTMAIYELVRVAGALKA
ncbi:MAG: HAD-IIIA family hydrolase [Alphaproteobacteria bacterium]|nr:HAD-IIIA family hydrolase [Alphaproteobacteria bacterium]